MTRDHLFDQEIDDPRLEEDATQALPRTPSVAAASAAEEVAGAVAGDSAGAATPAADGPEVGDVPATSRKVRRRGRRTRMRSKTIAMKRLTKEELRQGAMLYPPIDVPRPRTRGECKEEQRPCPWVSCKHHLYLDVNPETGSIKLNFPDLEVWEMKETCALDVADKNGITLEEVGEIMNLTRERIRQVEVRGLLKLKMLTPIGEDGDF